jgi:DNA-binding NarL/FixJ family response regulator
MVSMPSSEWLAYIGTEMPTRILVADDHAMFRQGLVSMLADSDVVEVVAQASRGDEALRLIRELSPAVAILDVTMPGATGIEVARAVAEAKLPTRVVLLTMHADATHARQAVDAGAAGYVLKSAVFDELMRAVTVALEGGVFITASLTAKVLRGGTRPALTTRELEILTLIAAGKTSRAIGRKLGITVRTVETHRANMMAKLDVDNAAALVRYAVENGLVGG